MPDLAKSSVMDWLRQTEPDKPAVWDGPVTLAEAQPEVEAALVAFGEALDRALAQDPARLEAELLASPGRDDLRTVMAQLGSPRTLRIIGWIMQAGLPRSDAVLAAILTPDPSGAGQYLQADLCGAVRPPLLERLYAPERLGALLEASRPPPALREVA